MATKTLTDEDIRKIDSKTRILTDSDIESMESSLPTLSDDDIRQLDLAKSPGMGMQIANVIFTPISKQVTGKSLSERTRFLEKGRQSVLEKSLKQEKPMGTAEFVARTIPSGIADIGTELADVSPFDVALMAATGPLGKMVGKIPIGGSTIGKIVSEVPVSKLFSKGVGEFANYQHALKTLPSRVAASRKPLMDAIAATDSIKKVTLALKHAGLKRGEQELLYSAERAKRAGVLTAMQSRMSGEKGFIQELSSLKGELPKAQYEGIRNKLSQWDINNLFNFIKIHRRLNPYEKITAQTGLSKLLGAEGGSVPTEGELTLLSEVFPENFIKTILSKRSSMKKILEGTAEVLNVPRALMTSYDMSGALRQGIFLIGRPKQWIPSFGNMFRYFFNEKAYQGLMTEIKLRPTYALMKKAKLSLSDMSVSLSGREEAFMSRLAEHIPFFGRGVRASNRAYSGFLNKLRVDTFDDLVGSATRQGIKLTPKILRNIGNFVNSATGRGELPGGLKNASVAINSIFFSPRLMASRINLMNPAYYIGLDPFTRKEALKSLFTFAGIAGTVMTLAKSGGAEIGMDPRSADFGKIKFGKTRYDILGGFQQYIRLAAQLITGEHISSTTGVKTTVGEGYKPLNRYEILSRFIQSKEAPVTSFATNLLKGKGSLGQDFDMSEELISRFTPMVTQDMADLYKERGFEGIGMAIPAIFGVSVQTYSATPSEIVYSAKAVISYARRLYKEGRVEEAQKMLTDNKDILEKANVLSPMEDRKGKWESIKEEIKRTVRLSPEEKEIQINIYDDNIQKLDKEMEETLKGLK